MANTFFSFFFRFVSPVLFNPFSQSRIRAGFSLYVLWARTTTPSGSSIYMAVVWGSFERMVRGGVASEVNGAGGWCVHISTLLGNCRLFSMLCYCTLRGLRAEHKKKYTHTHTVWSAEENQVVAEPRGAVCAVRAESPGHVPHAIHHSTGDDVYPPNPMSPCVRFICLTRVTMPKTKKN